MRTHRNQRGFTLVEILIVVIILGILAAIVIPQFTSASQDARKNSLASQLQTLRSQVELYKLQHLDQLPSQLVTEGHANPWEQLVNKTNAAGAVGTTAGVHVFGPYLQQVPRNPLNGSDKVRVVTTDVTFGGASGATNEGFIINSSNGKIWGTSAKFAFVYNEQNPADENNEK
jgi:general secretion pathway protein G